MLINNTMTCSPSRARLEKNNRKSWSLFRLSRVITAGGFCFHLSILELFITSSRDVAVYISLPIAISVSFLRSSTNPIYIYGVYSLQFFLMRAFCVPALTCEGKEMEQIRNHPQRLVSETRFRIQKGYLLSISTRNKKKGWKLTEIKIFTSQ